jgi:hypothetical protein
MKKEDFFRCYYNYNKRVEQLMWISTLKWLLHHDICIRDVDAYIIVVLGLDCWPQNGQFRAAPKYIIFMSALLMVANKIC